MSKRRPAKGDVLGGRYRVEEVIGAGSMGLVVRARQLDLDRLVAIKVLLPDGVEEERIERLRREARALARLTSSHVSRLLDIGELDSGAPFLVMELLSGQDLAELLRERGPLPISMTVRLALEACDALAEAHDAGIVHRDIKPSNMFLAVNARGITELKVLDFGISKISSCAAREEKALTRASQLLGSPIYMSPEQVLATRDVDARSDVWSLGVVLHELLCGERPFDGESVTDVCVRIVEDAAPSLVARRPAVPAPLAAVVLRCLEKDPTRRYASAAELACALAPFRDVPSQDDVGRGCLEDLASEAPTLDWDLGTTASKWWRARIHDQRRRRRQVGAVLACVASIGVASLCWPREEVVSPSGFGLVTTSSPLPSASALPTLAAMSVEGSPSGQRRNEIRVTTPPVRAVKGDAGSFASDAPSGRMATVDPGY